MPRKNQASSDSKVQVTLSKFFSNFSKKNSKIATDEDDDVEVKKCKHNYYYLEIYIYDFYYDLKVFFSLTTILVAEWPGHFIYIHVHESSMTFDKSLLTL